ncbi:hypothetical protein LTR08_007903 [Meristemomyces frigidus]|nr:hypothetical protein LTR08_007903 [Meristemomyces frigidus]
MDTGEHIAYISSIGATSWGKPLFITGSAVAVVVFDFAFLSERWLRHNGRLTKNYSTLEKVLSGGAILFAIIGACGLIFLTIFDTHHYPKTHSSMLVVFIAGYIISAIFLCAEYQRLGVHYREHRILRASFWIKLIFIVVELALAISFAVMSYRGSTNKAAILEWTVSLIYIFYIWSFIMDFLPATRTRAMADRFGLPQRSGDDEMAMNANQVALEEDHVSRHPEIDPQHRHTHAYPTTEEQGLGNRGTYLNYPSGQQVPAIPSDRYRGDASSYDSQQPMAERTGPIPTSRNF